MPDLRVSVLMRVTGEESHLLDCLKSLNNQILDSLEVLCLTTLPQDKTKLSQLEPLKDYAKKDSRIKIVPVKFSDYGKIMNHGIDLAQGEYLSIIDSDDFVDPEMFIELFALAKKYDADIVRSNYYEYHDDKNDFHESIIPEETGYIIEPTEDTRIFYQPPIIGTSLYKKTFLEQEKLFFLESFAAPQQDISFNFKTLSADGKIALTDKAYLHHRRQSLKFAPKDEKEIFYINDEYAEVEKFLKNRKTWKVYGYIFQAVKFASYHWNMLRLPNDKLEPYLLRIRVEFHDADNKHMLVKKYFPKNHWRALQSILRYPPQVFLTIFKSYRKKKS